MATLALQPCGPELEAPQFERMSQAIEDLGCRLDRIEGLLFLSDFEHFQKLDALIRNCKDLCRGPEDVLPRSAIAEAEVEVSGASSASSEPPAQQMCSDVHRNLASAMLAKQQQLQQASRNSASSKKQKKQRKQQLQEEADSSNAAARHGDRVGHQLIETTLRNVQRDTDQKAMEAKCRDATALQDCMRIGEAAKKSRYKPQLMTIPGNRPVGFSADSGTGEAGQQQEEQQGSKGLLNGRADDAKKFRFRPQLMTIPGNRAVGSLETPGEKDDPGGKSCGILQAQLAWSQAAVQESSRESQKPAALHCQRSMLNLSDFSESGDGDAGVILECFGGKGAGLSWKGKGAGLPLALSHAAEPGSETI